MSEVPISKSSSKHTDGFIRVATLEELKTAGMVVVRGTRCPLLVVYDDGKVFALDNRCPHLGFPLHRGSVDDGILTCHWHHARFDLASGCTFDLWADDVPTAAVELRDGVVWVCPQTRYSDGDAHWRNRLREGLEQNIGLVLAKAVLGLIGEGVDYRALVHEAVLFGARNRDGWGIGLTILTALAKLIPCLPEEETYLALYKGISRVARDCDGAAPRRDRLPLAPRQFQPLPVLERWFRHWTRVRHRDAAERTLLTAIASGASSIELATLMLTAVTDRYFADGGHALDFTNKAFESLDIIGWEHAPAILPSLVDQIVSARGSEESNAWRQPIDLVPLCEATFAELPELLDAEGIATVDGVLLDLGVSSPQIDDPARGFSLRADGPLDMRMDPTRGQTAAEWLAGVNERELRGVIADYGEERFAQQIAGAVVAARAHEPIVRTRQLAAIVAKAVGSRGRGDWSQDPATRTFQAIRIFINQELQELPLALDRILPRLRHGGRLAVISFHSLEDRLVKQFFRRHSQPYGGDVRIARLPIATRALPRPPLELIGRAIRASEAEVAANPRSRSAVMRVAERTDAQLV